LRDQIAGLWGSGDEIHKLGSFLIGPDGRRLPNEQGRLGHSDRPCPHRNKCTPLAPRFQYAPRFPHTGASLASYRGSGTPLVSRPISIAMMLSSAKQLITAVTRLKLPPKAPTSRPATKGPKLVMIRAAPLQNATPVERMWVGNSSGK
jgi:hypothetical protein